jgi:hypothetical protein
VASSVLKQFKKNLKKIKNATIDKRRRTTDGTALETEKAL